MRVSKRFFKFIDEYSLNLITLDSAGSTIFNNPWLIAISYLHSKVFDNLLKRDLGLFLKLKDL